MRKHKWGAYEKPLGSHRHLVVHDEVGTTILLMGEVELVFPNKTNLSLLLAAPEMYGALKLCREILDLMPETDRLNGAITVVDAALKSALTASILDPRNHITKPLKENDQ